MLDWSSGEMRCVRPPQYAMDVRDEGSNLSKFGCGLAVRATCVGCLRFDNQAGSFLEDGRFLCNHALRRRAALHRIGPLEEVLFLLRYVQTRGWIAVQWSSHPVEKVIESGQHCGR